MVATIFITTESEVKMKEVWVYHKQSLRNKTVMIDVQPDYSNLVAVCLDCMETFDCIPTFVAATGPLPC